MKVFDLACCRGHRFEGWFASAADFDAQTARGLIECPLCGSVEIAKQLSAPRINLGATPPRVADAAPARAAAPAAPDPALHALLLATSRKLAAQTENVGARFADEARAIHLEEAPRRAIRGVASGHEIEELLDEGIAVLPLPFADELDEPLQ